jgi:hypothetical protein
MTVYYTNKAPSAGGGPTVGVGWARVVVCPETQVALTTTILGSTAHNVGLFYVPAGFVIMGAAISGASAMDTNGSPTLTINVGDSGSNTRIFSASTVAQGGTYSTAMAAGAHFYKFTARTEIRAYIQAVAATAVAGTLRFALTGFIDPDYNTTALTAS